MTDASSKEGRPDKAQRLTTYQNRLRALKERSSLREVMERELLLEILHMNSSAINEFPMIQAQQNSVAELLCGRIGHPCCEYLQQHVANFSVLLTHYEKAVGSGDAERSADLQGALLNIEAVLIKCVQGIVYTMALITDNFEELVLRYFGQEALGQYSGLIEKHPLDQNFWDAFVEEFIASRVAEAHREILEGEKYTITKERTFLVIRFLFDDILSKLNPTDAEISKTRIQKGFIAGRTLPEGRKRAKFVQAMLAKGLSSLSQFQKLTAGELLQAATVSCIDNISQEFETQYQARQEEARAAKEKPGSVAKDPAVVKQEQAQFKFLMDQVVGLGVGSAIAIGVTSDHFYKALESFVPDQIQGILQFRKDFSIPVLEKILYFLLENHTIQILKECGREEGSKIQVRSGRARRVSESAVDGLPGMSKIRKKQLFGNDVTREETLLFKPKTAQQMAQTMSMLSLEKELQQALSDMWKQAVFRVDIMVLINLELVAKTTTNVTVKLSEILEKYGITKAA